MAMSFLKIHGIGNLTRNPELRYAPSGTPILNFGFACTYVYTTNNEKKEEKCFINGVAFGKLAESSAQYLAKGSRVYVEGRISWRTWQDKDSGAKRETHEIVADRIVFLDTNKRQGQAEGPGDEEGGPDGPDE